MTDAAWAAVSARAIESHFERSIRAIAGSTRDVPIGWGVRTDELPLVWTLNQLRVSSDASADEIATTAGQCQHDLPYRHVVVSHAPTGEAAAPTLRAAGWRVEREVVMAIDDSVDLGAPADAVAELTEDEGLELMAAWLLEERDAVGDDGLAQVLEYNRREGRAWDERRFGVVADDGAPVAITKLRVDGRFAWVEDVYALPAARGRGIGRRLVTHAVRDALDRGCSLIAIVADANDWPQHLYASVGFHPVDTSWIFHADTSVATAVA